MNPGDISSKEGGNAPRLTPRDLAKFLHRLARVYADPRMGNPPLSAALDSLADALKSGQPDLKAAISASAPIPHRPKQDRADLAKLSFDEAEAILRDEKQARSDLIQLGLHRLGIPRSRLLRMSREAIVEAMRSALEHERSLAIIASEAQRGGSERRS